MLVNTPYVLNANGALESILMPVFPTRKPANMSITEHELYEVNSDDHEWRKKYLDEMPGFLSGYFGRRYETLFNTKGRRVANTFLRTAVGDNVLPRLKKVSDKYKITAFAADHLQLAIFDDFEKLPTLDRQQIRNLAHNVAMYIETAFNGFIDRVKPSPDSDDALFKIYAAVADLLTPFNITPPYWSLYTNEKMHDRHILSAIARMTSPTWWTSQIKRRRDLQREHLSIAVGQVQKAASAYVSRTTLGEWKEQKKRNWEFFKKHELENQDGDRASLETMVLASNANPAVRRVELMVRMRGFEDLADELGCVGEFYTITAPSKYHAVRSSGGFNQKWNGSSPRDTQKYLCNVWARIRAALSREDLRVFGFRVVEPHHDGTPHWHMLLFMPPEHVDAVRDIMCYHARIDDSEELQSDRALKARFHVEPIDKEKGSATGYIAKYISKNIDGFALDGETDNETGQDLKGMSKSITAWSSRWKIRQFQQIGGAPVTVWRELRRVRGDEQIFNDADMDNVRFAADIGDWYAYTELQGGAFVARKNLTVRLSYETIEEGGAYAEEIKKVQGVFSPYLGVSSEITTRTVKWKIVPKSAASADDALNMDRNAVPWSSVNNCTEPQRRVSRNIELQLKSRGETGDPEQVSILIRGGILRTDPGKGLRIANNQLVDVTMGLDVDRVYVPDNFGNVERVFLRLGI
ncbi:replication endonuclease [Limnobaculum xujianqingii]|uniref:replication endonuclease n=1 Tax=Limnobaculum xujianqingii TaxID=2738837 RepID=UPI0015BF6573|nr:replication endonuclease [Limnobaculum xujianqingii]